MMPPSRGPMSLRQGGDVAWTIIAWVALGLSLASCIYFTLKGFAFSHEVTCEGTAPTAYRQSFTYAGLVMYVVLALPALVLVLRKRSVGTIVAAGLAVFATSMPFITYVLPVMSSAMC